LRARLTIRAAVAVSLYTAGDGGGGGGNNRVRAQSGRAWPCYRVAQRRLDININSTRAFNDAPTLTLNKKNDSPRSACFKTTPISLFLFVLKCDHRVQ
jgi:hypothetical protein